MCMAQSFDPRAITALAACVGSVDLVPRTPAPEAKASNRTGPSQEASHARMSGAKCRLVIGLRRRVSVCSVHAQHAPE